MAKQKKKIFNKEESEKAAAAKGSVRHQVHQDLIQKFVSNKMTDRKKDLKRGKQKHKGRGFQ